MEMDHYFVHIIQKDLIEVLMKIKIEHNLGNLFIWTTLCWHNQLEYDLPDQLIQNTISILHHLH